MREVEWLSLHPRERNRYMKTRTNGLVEAGRLIAITPGSYRSGARYAVSPEMGILLAARSHPTFVIASHFSSRLAPLSFFAIGDETKPVRGVVMAVPVAPPGKVKALSKPSPVADVFDHILTTPSRAAEFLADRVIRPVLGKPASRSSHLASLPCSGRVRGSPRWRSWRWPGTGRPRE